MVTPRAEITTRRIVCPIPQANEVEVVHVPCRTDRGAVLPLDLYRPAGARPGSRTPAVVFVTGYPDAGMQAVLGCAAREMASYVSWAELVAVSGMTGVTYATFDPVADARGALDCLRSQAETLGIDDRRIAVWACSGNVPNALGLLMDVGDRVKCAALCYGYMLDLDGANAVASAAASFRFANPCAGSGVGRLPDDLPMLIVRAGADEMPGLNASIDAFVSAALRHHRPLTLVNHARAPHAFDILDDCDASRAVIGQVVSFLQGHLGAA